MTLIPSESRQVIIDLINAKLFQNHARSNMRISHYEKQNIIMENARLYAAKSYVDSLKD
jgi:hypothetical protein